MSRPVRSLTFDEWRSLLRAAWWLVVVRLSLVLLGFTRTRTWTKRARPRPGRNAIPIVVGWSVEAVGRRLPGMKCLSRALAAEVILRRGDRDPKLCFGVVRDADKGIEAHAWVEDAGRIVVGGHDRERFTLLQEGASSSRSPSSIPDRSPLD